jgi:F-type H+-transporting ATPase subunit epsilon
MDVKEVLSITAETEEGSFGIFPHRLDCVAALEPGILSYELEKGKKKFVAVDEGILIKVGFAVFVSVRNAIEGDGLDKLYNLVESEFKKLNEQEKDVRSAMVKLESGFMRSFQKYRRDL